MTIKESIHFQKKHVQVASCLLLALLFLSSCVGGGSVGGSLTKAPLPPESFNALTVTPSSANSSGGVLIDLIADDIGLAEDLFITIDDNTSLVCSNVTYVLDDKVRCLTPSVTAGVHSIVASVGVSTRVSYQTNGESIPAASNRAELYGSASDEFLKVAVGDVVEIVAGGTYTTNGHYTVLEKISNQILRLDRNINNGLGTDSSLEYKIVKSIVSPRELGVTRAATPTKLFATITGAFFDVTVGDVVAILGGDNLTANRYATVVTKNSAEELTLSAAINDGVSDADNIVYDISQFGAHTILASDQSGQLGLINLAQPSRLITTAAPDFTTVEPGDVVLIKSGANVLTGQYLVASKQDATTLTLDRSALVDLTLNASSITFEVQRTSLGQMALAFKADDDQRKLQSAVVSGFSNVMVGDAIGIFAGTNINTGAYKVVDKLSSSVVVLDRAISNGVADSSDVQFNWVASHASSKVKGEVSSEAGRTDIVTATNRDQFADVLIGDTLTILGSSRTVNRSYAVVGKPTSSSVKLSHSIGPLSNIEFFVSRNSRLPRYKASNAVNFLQGPTPLSITTSDGLNKGATLGGTTVTVTGSSFASAVSVVVGGVTCGAPVVATDGTSLTCTMPSLVGAPHAKGYADLVVTNTVSGRAGTLKNGYLFVQVPRIDGVSPIGGTPAGNYDVTITGEEFDTTTLAASTAQIGGSACTISSKTSTEIICHLPAGAYSVGAKDVVVTNVGPAKFGALASGFLINNTPTISLVQPASLRLKGGESVTLTGTNFVNASAGHPIVVTIAGETCTSPAYVSATKITCTSPVLTSESAAAAVNLTLPTEQTASSTVTVDAVPEVSELFPTDLVNPGLAIVSVGGGAILTIDGYDFVSGVTTVTMDHGVGACTGVTVAADNHSLTCTVPSHGIEESVNVTVTVGGNQVVVNNGVRYAAIPNVLSVTPSLGRPKGGELITIGGTDMPNLSVVKIGGIVCSSPTYVTTSQIQCTAPASTLEGTFDVTVTSPANAVGTRSNAYTYEADPEITSVTPTSLPLRGGVEISIAGHDLFQTAGSISITGNSCPITAVDPNRKWIKCSSPTVLNEGGATLTVTVGSEFASTPVTYDAEPTITAATNNSGPLRGGTTLSIAGTDFINGATTVTVAGVACDTVTASADHSTLTCVTSITTPSLTEGAKDIVVSVAGGGNTNATTLTGGFNYDAAPTVASVNPVLGPISGGITLTVTGTDFVAGATSVLFITDTSAYPDVSCASVSVAADNKSLTCVIGAVADNVANVDIQVSVAGFGATLSGTGNNLYQFTAQPALSAITPNAGKLAGGVTITVDGADFTPTMNLYVAKVAAPSTQPPSSEWDSCTSLTYISPLQVTCIVPSHLGSGTPATNLEGGYAIRAKIGSNFTLSDPPYTYNATPVISTVTPNVGPLKGGASVTIVGTEFLGSLDSTVVTIGGAACNLISNSETQIVCLTPVHTTEGAKDVVVSVGTTSNTKVGAYTYDAVPEIVSISPVNGKLVGGNTLTISGHDFVNSGITTVDVMTVGACPVTAIDPSNKWIECTAPAHYIEEARDVKVTVGDHNVTSASLYTYDAEPTVTNVAPANGPLKGGTEISISGTEFYSSVSTTVTVGGNPCNSLTWYNMNSITCRTPINLAEGIQDVVVRVAGIADSHNSVVNASSKFTYDAVPQITSISPSIGPLRGGTIADGITGAITISGYDLTVGSVVTFAGGGTCTSVTPAADNRSLTCIPSAFATPQTVDVTVTVGTNSGAKTSGFQYASYPSLTSVSPTFGPLSGGTTITLTGTDYTAGTTVKLNGVNCGSVNVVDATSLTCVTSSVAGNIEAPIIVTKGANSSSEVVKFRFESTPTVTSVAPSIGPLTGGTAIVISGTEFINGSTVTIDGQACLAVFVQDSNTITCNTPADATEETVDVVVSSPNSLPYVSRSSPVTVNSKFTYDAVPSISTVSPASGSYYGSTTITITGSELLGSIATTVDIGGVACGSVVATAGSLTCVTGAAGGSGIQDVTVTVGTHSATKVSSFTYLKANGDNTASVAAECSTGNLVDGYCCDTACSGGTCQTCGALSSNGAGTCGFVNTNSADPRGTCTPGGASNTATGCQADMCSGSGYSCGYQTTGDGGCPNCQTCTGATSQACLNHTAGFQDSCTGAFSCVASGYKERAKNLCNGSGACANVDLTITDDCTGTCANSCNNATGACDSNISTALNSKTCTRGTNIMVTPTTGNGQCNVGVCNQMLWGSEQVESPVAEPFYTDHTSLAKVDSSHILLAGYNLVSGASQDLGSARMGSLSGTTITWGTNLTFNADTTKKVDLAVLSSTLAVVAYQSATAGSHLEVKALSLNTATNAVTAPSAGVTLVSASSDQVQIAAIDATHFVVVYTNLGVGVARVGTVTGTTITLGGEQTFNASTTYVPEVVAFGTKIIIAYANSSNRGTMIVGDANTGTGVITFGAPQNFPDYAGATGLALAFNLKAANATNKVVMNYLHGNTANSGGYMMAATVAGTTLTFGSEVQYASSVDYSYVAQLGTDNMMVVYTDSSVPYFREVQLTGTTISLQPVEASSPAGLSDEVIIEGIDGARLILHRNVSGGTGSSMIGQF